MMYCDYPTVSHEDWLNRAPSLDIDSIAISPEQAYATLDRATPPDGVRLTTFDGRPVYRFRSGDSDAIVYADDGRQQSEFSPELTRRIAAAWTRQPATAARVEENDREDQWTVSGEFEDLRPILKYSWPNGEQVYVSQVTGDVVQYTTRKSRLKAYLGPIPHWLYFTPLRKHGKQWSQLVIWAAGLAAAGAVLGIVVAVSAYSPTKRFRHQGEPSSLPFRRWKRWHSIFGLLCGITACTWAFSGMLSMDPFPRLQRGSARKTGARLAAALRKEPITLREFSVEPPQQVLSQIRSDFPAKELEFISFAGEPTYLAYGAASQTLVLPLGRAPVQAFERDKIIEIIRGAARPVLLTQVRLVTRYEAYYLDRQHTLPLPALFAELGDAEHSGYYVDPKTARIVKAYDSRSRRNRWLYHGLHSIDLPVLYYHRPSWDVVVLALLLGGTLLCLTSLKLAWEVVRRRSK